MHVACVCVQGAVALGPQNHSTTSAGMQGGQGGGSLPTKGRSILDTPLWFGEVVPGSGFSRRLSVRNTTMLAFPFRCESRWACHGRCVLVLDLVLSVLLCLCWAAVGSRGGRTGQLLAAMVLHLCARQPLCFRTYWAWCAWTEGLVATGARCAWVEGL